METNSDDKLMQYLLKEDAGGESSETSGRDDALEMILEASSMPTEGQSKFNHSSSQHTNGHHKRERSSPSPDDSKKTKLFSSEPIVNGNHSNGPIQGVSRVLEFKQSITSISDTHSTHSFQQKSEIVQSTHLQHTPSGLFKSTSPKRSRENSPSRNAYPPQTHNVSHTMKSPVQPHHHDSTSVKVGEAELQNPHIKVALSSPVKNTMEIETGANIEPRSPIFDPHLSSTLHKMIANNQMDTSSSPGITIKTAPNTHLTADQGHHLTTGHSPAENQIPPPHSPSRIKVVSRGRSTSVSKPEADPVTLSPRGKSADIDRSKNEFDFVSTSNNQMNTESTVFGSQSTSDQNTDAIIKANQTEKPPISPALLKTQYKWMKNVIRTMKRHGDAGPFLVPVDPIALGIPDYFKYIKNPMDISTIDKKVQNNVYTNGEEFIADLKLMINNCYLYNPSDHPVYACAKNLEKSILGHEKKMPLVANQPAAPKSHAHRAHSVSGSTEDMNSTPGISRPRREVHAPPTKELPYEVAQQKKKIGGTRYRKMIQWCLSIYKELMKKDHDPYMFLFHYPVDAVALNLPTYHDVITHPMDLSTIKKKLDTCEYGYEVTTEFDRDMRLMFQNSFTFNGQGGAVFEWTKRSLEVYESKWREMPYFPEDFSLDKKNKRKRDDSGSSSSDEGDFGNIAISVISDQIRLLQQQLDNVRHKKKSKHRKSDKSRRSSKEGVIGESSNSRRRSRAPELREITMEDKKVLGDAINLLSPEKLQKVVEIIRESVSIDSSGQEEIELDLDTLDIHTLNKLWNLVKGPNRQRKRPPSKPASVSNAATSVPNQQSETYALDHQASTSRIHELERELAFLEGRPDKAPPKHATMIGQMSQSQEAKKSDSESGSSGSGSDTDGSDSD